MLGLPSLIDDILLEQFPIVMQRNVTELLIDIVRFVWTVR